MSNIVIFLIIFVFLLIIGGWITSEMISGNASKANKKLARQIAILETEKLTLQSELAKSTESYSKVKDQCDRIEDARVQVRALETNYRKLTNQFKRTSAGIDIIREQISGKKYSSNSLAREVLLLLDEHCPNSDQRKQIKEEKTKEDFKRIKTVMNMET